MEFFGIWVGGPLGFGFWDAAGLGRRLGEVKGSVVGAWVVGPAPASASTGDVDLCHGLRFGLLGLLRRIRDNSFRRGGRSVYVDQPKTIPSHPEAIFSPPFLFFDRFTRCCNSLIPKPLEGVQRALSCRKRVHATLLSHQSTLGA